MIHIEHYCLHACKLFTINLKVKPQTLIGLSPVNFTNSRFYNTLCYTIYTASYSLYYANGTLNSYEY